jgi:hypothetical protein
MEREEKTQRRAKEHFHSFGGSWEKQLEDRIEALAPRPTDSNAKTPLRYCGISACVCQHPMEGV